MGSLGERTNGNMEGLNRSPLLHTFHTVNYRIMCPFRTVSKAVSLRRQLHALIKIMCVCTCVCTEERRWKKERERERKEGRKTGGEEKEIDIYIHLNNNFRDDETSGGGGRRRVLFLIHNVRHVENNRAEDAERHVDLDC